MQAIEISLSGLDVEWRRMEIIAQNIANMNTTRTADGDVFQPLRLISGPDQSFSAILQNRTEALPPSGVRVFDVVPVENGLRMAFEPDNPLADEDGFVTYPNVDHAGEMVNAVRTQHAYQANLTAMSIAQQMYSRALEMGRGA